jgi:DNA-binding NarL/FixJ family response regulator
MGTLAISQYVGPLLEGRVDPAGMREGRGGRLGDAVNTEQSRFARGERHCGIRPPAPAAAPAPSGRDHHAELLLRSLSEREREILALLARGHSNRRIAEGCRLSLNTVRTHVQNVLVKLGVHSKLEAAALAVRRGLVPASDPRDGDA